MRPRTVRRLAALLVLATFLGVGCSSSSSGGATPTPTASVTADGIDRGGVDAILSHVLTGLKTATAIPKTGTLAEDGATLHHASTELLAAAALLNPPPLGVPGETASTTFSGLDRVGEILQQASACLVRAAQAKPPAPKSKAPSPQAHCVALLKQANENDAVVAKSLISLSAYGTESPKTFTAQLTAALQGR